MTRKLWLLTFLAIATVALGACSSDSDDELTSVFDFVNGTGSLQFPDANFVDLGVSDALGQPQSVLGPTTGACLSHDGADEADLAGLTRSGRNCAKPTQSYCEGDR